MDSILCVEYSFGSILDTVALYSPAEIEGNFVSIPSVGRLRLMGRASDIWVLAFVCFCGCGCG